MKENGDEKENETRRDETKRDEKVKEGHVACAVEGAHPSK
jgi:hypothetical protein